MNRLFTLGLFVSSVGGATAGDPVPVVPSPGGSLSQSLPSVVNGGLAISPPPVMVSQPTWGAPAPVPAAPYQVYPSLQPVPIPQFQGYPAYPTTPCVTGCGSRGSLLDRLRAWLCGGPGPAYRMGFVFAPPVAPPRAWMPNTVEASGIQGTAGWPGKCDENCGRIYPSAQPLGQRIPRPIAIPLPRGGGLARPNLLRRVWDACVPGGGSLGGATATSGCATGNCSGCTPLLDSLLPSSGPVVGGSWSRSTPYPVGNNLMAAPAPIPLSTTSMAGGYPYPVATPPVPTTASQPFTQEK